nr:hypothetical protein [Pseudomonas syringae]
MRDKWNSLRATRIVVGADMHLNTRCNFDTPGVASSRVRIKV